MISLLSREEELLYPLEYRSTEEDRELRLIEVGDVTETRYW